MTKKEKELIGSLLGTSNVSENKEEKPRRPPRSRYWIAECYEEQMTAFIEFAFSSYIRSSGLRITYICHQFDVKIDDVTGEVICDEKTGEPILKKPHLHIIFDFSYPVSKKTATDTVGKFVANGLVILCHNPRSYERYFTHMDDPDKYQYDPSEIICINGYQFHPDAAASPLTELIGLWYCGSFASFPDFVRWCYQEHPDLVSTLVGCAHNFKLSVGIK